MNQSLWNSNVTAKYYDSLKGNIKTEALVIGGGIAGILTAYHLKKAGIQTVLVEGNRILQGVTKDTTAKITSQHGLIYHKLIKQGGIEKAKLYLDSNQLAVKKYKELSQSIDCDFEEKSAFIYSLSDRTSIENEVAALNKLGAPAQFKSSVSLPFPIAGAVELKHQAQFHPLKLLKELAKELTIYENTFVKGIKQYTAYTEQGQIKAKHIIVATHFPFLNRHGSYFLKMYQHRSYIIAVKDAINVDGMLLEEKTDGLSFRNYQNLLLVGGGDHRTGAQGGNYQVLRNFIKEQFPDANEMFAFATQDCMTLDGIPYIGNYSLNTERLYTATGFNKWGMTSSMVSALLLTDLITGKPNEYAPLFSPGRNMIQPQLFSNFFHAAGNLLSLSTKRCPHMGCALKWNKAERTWDCPCHGSRFDKNGKLKDNPAMKDLKSSN